MSDPTTNGNGHHPEPDSKNVVRAEPTHDPSRCKAYARTTGRQCSNAPMLGQQVCRMHGGASPRARAAAQRRLIDLVDPAIKRLENVLLRGDDKDAMRAVENVLDRAGYPRGVEVDVGVLREVIRERLHELRGNDDGR